MKTLIRASGSGWGESTRGAEKFFIGVYLWADSDSKLKPTD
jgi:hypothetical protein